MKFVRQSQRLRQGKSLQLANQQENIPPCVDSQACKVNIRSKMSQMEVQAVEKHRKEQQQYLEEIIVYLSNGQSNPIVAPDYFKIQSDITEHMRQILLNWLLDVHLRYKLQPQTLFIAVHIIDAYLSATVVPRTKLQLVGIAALWIASKYQETYQVPKIDNLVFICDSAFTKGQILQMESLIIRLLNFNLLFTTQLYYLESINQLQSFQSKDYFLCRYILQMCLFNLHFKKYSAKLMACSVAFFVRKLRKQEMFWSIREQQLFNVFQEEIKQCARDICMFWQQAQEIQTLNSLKIKFQSANYKEVAKIKIGQTNRPQPVGQLRA